MCREIFADLVSGLTFPDPSDFTLLEKSRELLNHKLNENLINKIVWLKL
jgi:hypothetical protein